ncbi:hypothetical protein F7725_003949 [Dissostichus mawsoni]|uniref:Uncharacterized protein n=1 Tax=Dissostichus mawsoni TaxID=36200 RepID=A0A7J5YCZ1_DISMA|nr:hypothetical protein F7725_003949 [Dissostichus mawsoni]
MGEMLEKETLVEQMPTQNAAGMSTLVIIMSRVFHSNSFHCCFWFSSLLPFLSYCMSCL